MGAGGNDSARLDYGFVWALAPNGHAWAGWRYLLLRVKRTCRASLETSVFDPGCVKTRLGEGCAELFSRRTWVRVDFACN
jgi:hypothetical protein